MRPVLLVGGLAVLLCSALQVNAQEFPVESNYGAKCTIAADGRQFDEFVMPQPPPNPYKYAIHFAHHWPEHVGDTVTVTCSKDGFVTKTLSFSRMPMRWISTIGPCVAPQTLTKEQQTTYCLNYFQASAMDNMGPPAMEFPRLPVFLDPMPN
jgi:hypothetical protein